MNKSFTSHAKIISWEFNWRFWKPVDCIGGRVFFGRYAVCEHVDGRKTFQNETQASIKLSMGVLVDESLTHKKNEQKN
ncbi:MAG: hypothetical protein AABY15_02660 [Nanoarchaeota archaeon]